MSSSDEPEDPPVSAEDRRINRQLDAQIRFRDRVGRGKLKPYTDEPGRDHNGLKKGPDGKV